MNEDSEKVAKFWGDRAKIKESVAECHWTDSQLIQRYYIHPTISGNSDSNWFMWVKDKYFSVPAEKALSLGCGDGCLERHGAFIDVFMECDAFDISPQAIDIAKSKAKEMGILQRINYDVCDINKIILTKKHYDVIFCAMSLHHIENLEQILYEIKNALKDEGLFIINEYVGPNRFQWTKRQIEIANEVFSLLPDKYRLDPTTNEIKNIIQRFTIEHMLETDPSEAVRSADIIPLIKERF
ncbi:MAG: class I SAM-dependent methyltransferase, partial [Nitrospira sp.]|nr:class I SAM-dependent methyltransferase [Nitrospira sp.]